MGVLVDAEPWSHAVHFHEIESITSSELNMPGLRKLKIAGRAGDLVKPNDIVMVLKNLFW